MPFAKSHPVPAENAFPPQRGDDAVPARATWPAQGYGSKHNSLPPTSPFLSVTSHVPPASALASPRPSRPCLPQHNLARLPRCLLARPPCISHGVTSHVLSPCLPQHHLAHPSHVSLSMSLHAHTASPSVSPHHSPPHLPRHHLAHLPCVSLSVTLLVPPPISFSITLPVPPVSPSMLPPPPC